MRISTATLGDYYAIQKMYSEFLIDAKAGPAPKFPAEFWLGKFSDPQFFVYMAHHGKQKKRFVGMVWGTLQTEKLSVEGVFVRRGFRDKFSAIKRLVQSVKDLAKQSGTLELCAIIPENQLNSVKRKGFKLTGHVVERTL